MSRIALHTKQLNFLKGEEQKALAAKEAADAAHAAADAAAEAASLDAINAKTAAKTDRAVGQETTALGQERASRVAVLSAASKRADLRTRRRAHASPLPAREHARVHASARGRHARRERTRSHTSSESLLKPPVALHGSYRFPLLG